MDTFKLISPHRFVLSSRKARFLIRNLYCHGYHQPCDALIILARFQRFSLVNCQLKGGRHETV